MKKRFTEHEINLPSDHECDISLIFPNDKVMQLQYRLESPSIDVVLPDNLSVITWKGDDMEPSESDPFYDGYVRIAKQLVIDFDPAWLNFPTPVR